MNLKSVYIIEGVLVRYPNDPCVPLMLSSLSPVTLGKLNPALVDALPPNQLRLIPDEILDQIGTNLRPGMRRGITNYTVQTPYQ